MRFTRDRNDVRPFEPGIASLPHLGTGREYAPNATQNMRARATEWAKSRGLPIVDSVVMVEAEGVTARVPLLTMAPGTALVRATALVPLAVTISLEPKSWMQRLRSRLGDAQLVMGDAAFDDQWQVETSDVDLARRLLDDERRRTLLDLPCWCRVAYRDGDIDVLLDAADMAGTHLLAGVEVAVHFASARLPTGAAYR